MLESLTTFVGGGGPRFWFSVAPEQQQLELRAGDHRGRRQARHRRTWSAPLQRALSTRRSPARASTCGSSRPASRSASRSPSASRARTSPTLRALAERGRRRSSAPSRRRRACATTGAPRASPCSSQVDPDRANLAGVTNHDVAASSATAMNGTPVDDAARGRQADSRSSRGCAWRSARSSSDMQNLYVYSSQGTAEGAAAVRSRRSSTRCRPRRSSAATSSARSRSRRFPVAGALPSEVLARGACRSSTEFAADAAARLPAGDRRRGGGAGQGLHEPGHRDARSRSRRSTWRWSSSSSTRSSRCIVFAAIPYGVVGALVGARGRWERRSASWRSSASPA